MSTHTTKKQLIVVVLSLLALVLFPPAPPASVVGRLRRRRRISFSFSLSPILTKSKSHTLYGDSSTSDDDDNFSKYLNALGAVVKAIRMLDVNP